MGYDNEIRKVYGKVKIIYTDSEQSVEVNSVTSGNGVFSYPSQVYEGHLSPTIKACTMDGNSTMGGGYQMMGHGLITGWWSDVHSGVDKAFSQPYPFIEIQFIARPVVRWTIIGDAKLGQFPVDFNIIAYGTNGLEKGRKEITGNDSVQITVEMENPMIDVTRMKLEIVKWSHPNAKAKIIQCFDVLEETYTGADVKQFEILEELATESEGVSFGINSDTASFTLYNRERKFDQGYLRALLLLDRKVIPSIGIGAEDGTVIYTDLGVFYSDEWEVPQKEQWVRLKCVDRLLKLQKKTYIGYPYSSNVTESTNTETVYSNTVAIQAKDKITMIVDYSATVSGAYINYLPFADIQLNFFRSSINAGSFELENLSESTKLVEITITGLILTVNTQTVVIQDEDSVAKYGKRDYTHAASDLVQSYGRAVEIGEFLLQRLSQGSGVLKITWRGDPALQLEEKFLCEDRFGNESHYCNEYNRYVFDGGLKQDTRAREVKDGGLE